MSVDWGLAWRISFCIALADLPAMARWDAKVCRRSWKRSSVGRPADDISLEVVANRIWMNLPEHFL